MYDHVLAADFGERDHKRKRCARCAFCHAAGIGDRNGEIRRNDRIVVVDNRAGRSRDIQGCVDGAIKCQRERFVAFDQRIAEYGYLHRRCGRACRYRNGP